MRKYFWVLVLAAAFIACQERGKKEVPAVTPGTSAPGSAANTKEAPEQAVMQLVMDLPETKKLQQDTTKFPGKHFEYLVSKADSTGRWVVQTGYGDSDRFETRYWVHVNPSTREILFYDAASDSLYTPADFRALAH